MAFFRIILFVGFCIGYLPISQAEIAVEKSKVDAATYTKVKAEAAARAKAEAAEKAKVAANTTNGNGSFANDDLVNFKIGIKRKIELSWVRPLDLPDGLHCVIRVKLGSDGTVLEAQVVQSSGNEVFDHSVVAAVSKAQPFKVPDDKEAFKEFRSFTLLFNP